MPRSPVPGPRWRDGLALVTSLCVAGLIAWPLLDRGWVPHDDGILGQTAERIRLGQLPHRDFEELYTGALGVWHALAQRLFGTTMMAPRYALFGVWCGWLAVVFGIARRATERMTPWWAAAITVAVSMWTIPVYPSAMPSWYLLFCATAAMAAMLAWNESRRPRWLLVAGAVIGVGLTVKITALYLLAAALLSIVFAAQERDHADDGALGPHSRWASELFTAGAVLLAGMVLWMLRDRRAPSELLHLAAPVVMLVLALAVRESRIARSRGRRWNDVLAPAAWLLAGVAVPAALFASPYLVTGSLPALLRGVFVDPLGRIGAMRVEMKSIDETTGGLAVLAFVAIELRWGASRVVKLISVAAGLWLAWFGSRSPVAYRAVWEGARLLLPATIAVIAVRAVRSAPSGAGDARQRKAALTLASFAALFALNQFPFSANVYFCFVAPLAFLALVHATPDAGSRLAGTLVLLGAFAVLAIHPGDIGTLGRYPARVDLGHRLPMARGGVRVSADDSARYAAVQALVTAHRQGRAVLAGPEIPEVPFLAGPPYYGHGVFEFIPRDLRDTLSVERLAPAEIAAVLVWNLRPAFGDPVSPAVKAWYDARFPASRELDESLEVRWRAR
jgi:hypothetical protein